MLVRKSLPGLLVAALLLFGAAAQATPVQITLAATITVDGTGAAPPGTLIDLNLFVDDLTPDEDPAAGLFLATNPGVADAFLLVDVLGPILSVTADSTGGDWKASGELVALGLITLPFQVVMNGVGLTPDQILPDFSGAFSGEIIVDVTPLAGLINPLPGPEVRATINTITIAPVPEPSLVALLGLGLGLAATVRRWRP
jgi:hypothetical protein